MGQSESKEPSGVAVPRFSAESLQQLTSLFGKCSADGSRQWCDSALLQVELARVLHPQVAASLCAIMCGSSSSSGSGSLSSSGSGSLSSSGTDSGPARVGYGPFVELANRLLKSSADHLNTLVWRVASDSTDTEAAPTDAEHTQPVQTLSLVTLRLYVARMVSSYMRLIDTSSTVAAADESSFCRHSDAIGRVSDFLLHPLTAAADQQRQVTREAFDHWLTGCSLLSAILLCAHRAAFTLDIPAPYRRVLPSVVAPDNYSCLLRRPELLALNWYLPFALRHSWRLLFSNALHGNSFSTVLKRVQHRGPTVLVVRDVQHAVFGGFASASWHCAGDFYGTHEAFVFSVSPELRVFLATGHNANYMYMNVSQKTLPNGMGFGGKLDYFGLWLSSEFGAGHSAPTCTTFDCKHLADKHQFQIECLEIWGVGDEPTPDEQATRPSVLDADPESAAMLQLARGGMHSDGLRPCAKVDSPSQTQLPPL